MISHELALNEIGGLLNRARLKWWVNSGTLLGLVREGRILPWDSDVDVSCWAHSDGLVEALPQLETLGFRVRLQTYRRMIYIAKLLPPARYGPFPEVHLQVFRRHGDVAWGVTRVTEPSPHPRGSPRWWALGAVRQPVRQLRRWVSSPAFERLIARVGFGFGTWVTPAEWFDVLGEVDGFPAPADPERYLMMRYGDWQAPDPEWDFRRDDPTFIAQDPSEVLPGLSPSPPYLKRRVTAT